jgi:hypothetical protein
MPQIPGFLEDDLDREARTPSGSKAESVGEALDGIGFVPTHGTKRITDREGHPQEPLTRWRKPKDHFLR